MFLCIFCICYYYRVPAKGLKPSNNLVSTCYYRSYLVLDWVWGWCYNVWQRQIQHTTYKESNNMVKKKKEPKPIEKCPYKDKASVIRVAGIEPGKPRFVGEGGELFARVNDSRVIILHSGQSIESALVQNNIDMDLFCTAKQGSGEYKYSIEKATGCVEFSKPAS